MTRPAFFIITTLMSFGLFTTSHAQNSGGMGTGLGGTATSGTAVRTGRGPLTQPVNPATSTTNPQQNQQNNARRLPGAALTYPTQQPFGSR